MFLFFGITKIGENHVQRSKEEAFSILMFEKANHESADYQQTRSTTNILKQQGNTNRQSSKKIDSSSTAALPQDDMSRT